MVAVVSAVVAVLGAVFTACSGYWWQARLRTAARMDYMSRYRDSLSWAAFDLQSRLFNVLYGFRVDRIGEGRGFLTAFLVEGNTRQADYARYNTAFVFAEYLGWAEIFRRDIQFLDLGRSDRNQHTVMLLSRISATLGSASRTSSEGFRIFNGDQRAIGEVMIASSSKPGERSCVGYAEFFQRVSNDAAFREWMADLISHVERAAREPDWAAGRLLDLQHQLIELIDFLDPKGIRFPREKRSRFNEESPEQRPQSAEEAAV